MRNRRVSDDDPQVTGGGPWEFDVPALAVGESWLLDLRNREKGTYRRYLPMETLQVTNESTESIGISINGIGGDRVPSSSVESYGDAGVERVEVTNNGSNATAAGGVVVTVKAEPFDADEQARRERSQPWLARAANDLIPGGVPGA